jgi:hypothetical protein
VTWQAYGENLEEKLKDLHERVHRGSYRARPARRTYIPKADGSKRPLSILCLEERGSWNASRRWCSSPARRASANHTDSAFYPIVSQMERAAGFVHDDTPQAKLDKLDKVLAHTSTSILLKLRNERPAA